MTGFLAEVRSVLLPDPAGRHGPLPPVLLSMTVVTGLVDAFSYLTLGHVFVANMTGNVVFLGFALAGAPGFSISASLTALAAFAAGAFDRPSRCRDNLSARPPRAGLGQGNASVRPAGWHGTHQTPDRWHPAAVR
jgi:Protein of unknown function (DUF1275)